MYVYVAITHYHTKLEIYVHTVKLCVDFAEAFVLKGTC